MSSPQSLLRHDEIEFSAWLVFDENGGLTLSRRRPQLTPRQRAAALKLTVPRTIFRTPELSVAIKVADPGPFDLDAATTAVAEALARGTDLKVEIIPVDSSEAR